MNINVEVVESSKLDNYIDGTEIPLAIWLPNGAMVTRKQQAFLERYYEKIVDCKGRPIYYCNIINAWKCKSMGYDSITFGNGKKEYIRDYKFIEKGGKYVLYPCFRSGNGIDVVSLIKNVRLKVAGMNRGATR